MKLIITDFNTKSQFEIDHIGNTGFVGLYFEDSEGNSRDVIMSLSKLRTMLIDTNKNSNPEASSLEG